MTRRQQLLCLAYAVIAMWALAGTWAHNVAYLPLGPGHGTLRFLVDTLVTASSRSITVDLLALCVSVWTWMLLEARRLKMRGAWWYVLGSVLIAVSAAVPLFLIHRERARARLGEGRADTSLSVGDMAGLAVAAVVGLAYTARSFGLVLAGLP